MDWKNLERYFDDVPEGFIKELLLNSEYPWSPLIDLQTHIEHYFTNRDSNGTIQSKPTVLINENGAVKEASYYVKESQILSQDFVDRDHYIFIGKGTLIEAGATIKNHTIVESNCEIRQGAYLRGNAFIGERSVVGHATEIKQSVFIRHVEAGHFAYVGDSIIGSYVNLGAGTKISNLEFRTLNAKKKDEFPEIAFRVEKKNLKTGISKFGAIIGDGCETGCNSVLSPFVFLEPNCWVLPNYCVAKGVYKKGSMLRQKVTRKKT